MISRKRNWYGKLLLERRAYYSPLRACSFHSSNGQVNLLTHKDSCESVIATVGWPRYWITSGLRQCHAICIPTCSPKLDAVEIQSQPSTEQGRPRAQAFGPVGRHSMLGMPLPLLESPRWVRTQHSHPLHWVSICYYCAKHLLPLQSAAGKANYRLPSTTVLGFCRRQKRTGCHKQCKASLSPPTYILGLLSSLLTTTKVFAIANVSQFWLHAVPCDLGKEDIISSGIDDADSARWLKGWRCLLSHKPRDLSLILRTQVKMKGKELSTELPLGLHVCSVAGSHPHDSNRHILKAKHYLPKCPIIITGLVILARERKGVCSDLGKGCLSCLDRGHASSTALWHCSELWWSSQAFAGHTFQLGEVFFFF